mmetsp:Transcript_14410/g.30798  ORF Transcript_14410/g.30798 Transcript_14410/m.30798 type:complete len:83 (+) Transcript_14410:102-350(+)
MQEAIKAVVVKDALQYALIPFCCMKRMQFRLQSCLFLIHRNWPTVPTHARIMIHPPVPYIVSADFKNCSPCSRKIPGICGMY